VICNSIFPRFRKCFIYILYYKERRQLKTFLTQIGLVLPLTPDPPVMCFWRWIGWKDYEVPKNRNLESVSAKNEKIFSPHPRIPALWTRFGPAHRCLMRSTTSVDNGGASSQPVKPSSSFNFACVGSGVRIPPPRTTSVMMLHCPNPVPAPPMSSSGCCQNNVKMMTAATMPRLVQGVGRSYQ
jgi:hypothetical protein